MGNSKGVRGAGGGRKDYFSEFVAKLQVVFDWERLCGHHVEREDVYQEFVDSVQTKIDVFLLKRDKYSALTIRETKLLALYEDRLQKLAASHRYKESYTARLQRELGLGQMQPSRYTPLSLNEEKVTHHEGCVTMQGFVNLQVVLI
jgi:hypothetical protein